MGGCWQFALFFSRTDNPCRKPSSTAFVPTHVSQEVSWGHPGHQSLVPTHRGLVVPRGWCQRNNKAPAGLRDQRTGAAAWVARWHPEMWGGEEPCTAVILAPRHVRNGSSPATGFICTVRVQTIPGYRLKPINLRKGVKSPQHFANIVQAAVDVAVGCC